MKISLRQALRMVDRLQTEQLTLISLFDGLLDECDSLLSAIRRGTDIPTNLERFLAHVAGVGRKVAALKHPHTE